jgi:four helix bundle protein
MTQQEMPIFVRSFDFLSWLLPVSNHFPKAQRFTVTSRLLGAAFDMREHLEAAQHRRGRERRQALDRADEALSNVRMYLRLSHHWGWLSSGQYQHAARMLVEIGRLLGGWQKKSLPK